MDINQEQSTNIVNGETNQINRINTTNIVPSTASTSNSSSSVVRNRQQELSSIISRGGGSTRSPVTPFQHVVDYRPRKRPKPYQRRVGTPAATATSTRNVNRNIIFQKKK